MYCPIYATGLNCLVNELLLWSDISSDHPIFIKTVASLTNKNLSNEIIEGLNNVNKRFSNLHMRVKEFKERNQPRPMPGHIMELKRLMQEFLVHDRYFLSLIPKIQVYGKEDKVWQELLNHIHHEQNFMFELFSDMTKQF